MTPAALQPAIRLPGQPVSLKDAPVTFNGQRVHHLDLLHLPDNRLVFADSVRFAPGEEWPWFSCIEFEDLPPRFVRSRASLANFVRAVDYGFQRGGIWCLPRTPIFAQHVRLEDCAWNDAAIVADFMTELEQSTTQVNSPFAPA